MLVRNVKAGESCQLRIQAANGSNRFHWTLVTINVLGVIGVIYTFQGKQYTVEKGKVNYHWWVLRMAEGIVNRKIGVAYCGRTHGLRFQIGVDASADVGIQWGQFEGTLRTGVQS